jgi:hypothetical protein
VPRPAKTIFDRTLRALASCVLPMCCGLPAAAAGHLSMQAGAFAPWQGDVGFSTSHVFFENMGGASGSLGLRFRF